VDVIAVATDQPFLTMAIDPSQVAELPPLVVVKVKNAAKGENESGHRYTGSLYISIGRNRLLARNGLRGHSISAADYTIADAGEVQQCVDQLTAKQVAAIQASAVFRAVLTS
jgi:hypothetical protein